MLSVNARAQGREWLSIGEAKLLLVLQGYLDVVHQSIPPGNTCAAYVTFLDCMMTCIYDTSDRHLRLVHVVEGKGPQLDTVIQLPRGEVVRGKDGSVKTVVELLGHDIAP